MDTISGTNGVQSSPVSRLLDTGSIPPVVQNTTSSRSTAKMMRAECRIELSTHHNPDGTERSRTVASQPLAPAGASSAAAFPAPQLAAENAFRDSRETIGAGGLGGFVFEVVVWCQRRKTRGRFQAGDVSHSPSPSPSQSHCHRPANRLRRLQCGCVWVHPQILPCYNHMAEPSTIVRPLHSCDRICVASAGRKPAFSFLPPNLLNCRYKQYRPTITRLIFDINH